MKKRIALLAILLCSLFTFAFSNHVDVHADFNDIDYEEVVIESQ